MLRRMLSIVVSADSDLSLHDKKLCGLLPNCKRSLVSAVSFWVGALMHRSTVKLGPCTTSDFNLHVAVGNTSRSLCSQRQVA